MNIDVTAHLPLFCKLSSENVGPGIIYVKEIDQCRGSRTWKGFIWPLWGIIASLWVLWTGCLLLFNCSGMSDSLWLHGLQHARLPCPSPSPRVCSNSCPLSRWCHPAILSSAVPFSSCPQSFLASGCFPMTWLFASGGQSIGASTSASVLPINIHDWFPLGLTGLISLQSKGLSGVFSSTTVRRHQFFGPQPFLLSSSHIHTWLLENHSFDYTDLCRQSNVSAF